MKGKLFTVIVLVVLIMLVFAGGVIASSPVEEIPWAGLTSLPDYIGAPTKAHPTANNGVPQNPFAAPNGIAHSHSDIWMSDTTNFAGPLGRNPLTLSTTLPGMHNNSWLIPTGSFSFDSRGRLDLEYLWRGRGSASSWWTRIHWRSWPAIPSKWSQAIHLDRGNRGCYSRCSPSTPPSMTAINYTSLPETKRSPF